jgi:nucleolar GTP-binding protein
MSSFLLDSLTMTSFLTQHSLISSTAQDIHPFYADLINVLYDRDHYKLALGQINVARHLIDNLAKDYVRLLKYGDSLFRCKQLKRAALGRMCTLMSKQRTSLAYLEEVRQHLARLPSIDPNTRTLILTGFPNVGKSSFINKVTHANCEVQPYPFTTKSLFVGHMDYKYLRWQVIDTPGILDHPLEERNTIEMQAVTALAHLHCCVLFFVDISEQCNYTIAQQVSLFNSIKPLFANKPICFVANKTDVVPFESLSEENRALLAEMAGERSMPLVPMSNISEDGIMAVKVAACDKLLEHRVATKLNSKKVFFSFAAHTPKPRNSTFSRSAQPCLIISPAFSILCTVLTHFQVDEISNRIHVTVPRPRDAKARPALVPSTVLSARVAAAARALADDEDEDDDDMGELGASSSASSRKPPAFAPPAKTPHSTFASAAASASGAPKRRTMRDIEAEHGGPGVFSLDYRTAHFRYARLHQSSHCLLSISVLALQVHFHFSDYIHLSCPHTRSLKNPEWATDVVPEIMDGKNVADFIDADIDARLEELEREEEEQQRAAEEAGNMDEPDWDLDEDQEQVLGEIRRARKLLKDEADLKTNKSKIVIPRTKKTKSLAEFEDHLDSMGIDHSKLSARARSRSRGDAGAAASSSSSSSAAGADEEVVAPVLGKRRGRSRSVTTAREASRAASAAGSDAGSAAGRSTSRPRSASKSKARPLSTAPPAGADGMRNVRAKLDIAKLTKKIQAKAFNRHGKMGESDHFVGTSMPRHLFSGKSGIGKSDWR